MTDAPIIQIPTPAVIRDAYFTLTVETFAPWLPTFRRFVADVGPEAACMVPDWESNMTDLSTLATLQGRSDYQYFSGRRSGPSDLAATMSRFARWLDEQGITSPEPATVPQGDSVVPIGPDHPGWDAWWEDLWEASDHEYPEQYNALARALGGPERQDEEDEERDFYVDVRIEAFTVSVPMVATRRQMDSGDYEIDEASVDNAIQEYIDVNSVSWSTEGYEEA